MFNTTVEVAGYTSNDKRDDAVRVLRMNTTEIVDAESFSPDTKKGRAMVAVETVRGTRILWYDTVMEADACVAEVLPTADEWPINEVVEQIFGVLADISEELSNASPLSVAALFLNKDEQATEDEEPAESDEPAEELSSEDEPS